MSGTVTAPDHALGGGLEEFHPGSVVVILPGHLAQGHDEYTTEYGSFILSKLGQTYQGHRDDATGKIGAMTFTFIDVSVMEVVGMSGARYLTKRQ